jgi:hypothetical protein
MASSGQRTPQAPTGSSWEGYAALRVPYGADDGYMAPQIDVSSLSRTRDGALGLAMQRDEQMRKEILHGRAHGYTAIVPVRITIREEVSEE